MGWRRSAELPRPSITRRDLVALSAALAATAAIGGRIATAASTLTLGDGEIQVLSDGNLTLPMGFYLPDRSPQEIAGLLRPHGLPLDAVQPDCNITLMRRGARVVLFDAGAGPLFQETAGRLVESLQAAGLEPADITDICFTHGHPDHLWGVLDDFDDPLFGNARYWMNRDEWDFWRAPGTLDAMPEGRQSFVVGARNRMAAIEDRVTLFAPGAEILPGVEAVAAVGHTPGHSAFMLHGAGDPVLVVGDALVHAVIAFERPDWHMGSDQEPGRAAATRRVLIDRLAADRARLIGFHLPYPGVGRVETTGRHYRFVPGT